LARRVAHSDGWCDVRHCAAWFTRPAAIEFVEQLKAMDNSVKAVEAKLQYVTGSFACLALASAVWMRHRFPCVLRVRFGCAFVSFACLVLASAVWMRHRFLCVFCTCECGLESRCSSFVRCFGEQRHKSMRTWCNVSHVLTSLTCSHSHLFACCHAAMLATCAVAVLQVLTSRQPRPAPYGSLAAARA
jgi:hypothetical protein